MGKSAVSLRKQRTGESMRKRESYHMGLRDAVHTDLYDNLDVIPFDKMKQKMLNGRVAVISGVNY